MRMDHITTYNNMDEFYKHDDKQKPQHILSKRYFCTIPVKLTQALKSQKSSL